MGSILEWMKNHPEIMAMVCFFAAGGFLLFLVIEIKKSRKSKKTRYHSQPSKNQETWQEKDARRAKVKEILVSWDIPSQVATMLAKADLTAEKVRLMSYDELLDVPGISHHWARKVLERTLGIPFEPVPQPGPLPIPEVLPKMSELPVSEVDLQGESLFHWYMKYWWMDHLLAGSFGKRKYFPADFVIMSEQELDRFLKDYRLLYDGRRGKLSDRRIDHIKEIVRRTKEGNR